MLNLLNFFALNVTCLIGVHTYSSAKDNHSFDSAKSPYVDISPSSEMEIVSEVSFLEMMGYLHPSARTAPVLTAELTELMGSTWTKDRVLTTCMNR